MNFLPKPQKGLKGDEKLALMIFDAIRSGEIDNIDGLTDPNKHVRLKQASLKDMAEFQIVVRGKDHNTLCIIEVKNKHWSFKAWNKLEKIKREVKKWIELLK